MKTLTHDQRMEGFTELEGVLGEGGVGGAHLMSFLAGIAHAEKIIAEPEQDEGPVAWMFFSSKGRPHYHLNEYQALEGLKMYGGSKVIALYEHPAPRKQDDEPVAWLIPGGVTERKDLAQVNGSNAKPLYLHPAPRKSFMRLSEEEIVMLAKRYDVWTHVIRAIEDALEEKNK